MPLKRFSLIRAGDDTLTVHRLVQAVTRDGRESATVKARRCRRTIDERGAANARKRVQELAGVYGSAPAALLALMFPVKAEDAREPLLLCVWAKQLVMLTLHRA